MTGWRKWSTGNCARNLNLTILTNGICTKQNPSQRMRYKILWDLQIQTDHLIPARIPDLEIIFLKKIRTCHLVDFAVPGNHTVKIKEIKKRDNYIDLTRELRKLWNIRGKVILIVAVTLRTILKGLDNGLEELKTRRRIETIEKATL